MWLCVAGSLECGHAEKITFSAVLLCRSRTMYSLIRLVWGLGDKQSPVLPRFSSTKHVNNGAAVITQTLSVSLSLDEGQDPSHF